MTGRPIGTVVFGDVVDSRRDPGSTAWLRSLRADLDAAYAREQRLASFGFTQGDELQGLLAPGADPFRTILRAALAPDARDLRWAVVAGEIEPGTGPATERTGPAFHAARDALAVAKARREGLNAITGDGEADTLLGDLGPLLPELLGGLTARQREVGRLLLVDRLRQAEVADRLGVSRATVSVMADRARIRHLERLARALAAIFGYGVQRVTHEVGMRAGSPR
jgi:DNA-binding Xre family transcriptional regulator